MRWLRSSVYKPGVREPVTMVIGEQDLTVPIEVAFMRMIARGYPPFADMEVFDHPGPLAAASIEGQRRARKRHSPQRRNRDITYYWMIGTLYITSPNGIVQTTIPAPMSSAQLRDALLEVTQHPIYKNQTINMYANDGKSVSVVRGGVAIVDQPPGGST